VDQGAPARPGMVPLGQPWHNGVHARPP
jgi:hypothetical protein